MHNKSIFFEKSFSEKRFVNVSVCESNIKSKKGTYYGKVCKVGRLNSQNLLAILKERAPHLDVSLVSSAFEQMVDIVLDMVGQGYNVDFFNLGTFSLGTSGKIEVNETREKNYEEEGNYDISNRVNKNIHFSFKFSPSQALKQSLKNIKMGIAVKKHKAPKIEKIENVLPSTSSASPTILKLKGNGLKLLGNEKEVGVYIEEKLMDENLTQRDFPDKIRTEQKLNKKMHEVKGKKELGCIQYSFDNKYITKIPMPSIIQNENKTLTIVLDKHLKVGSEYYITVVTQGVSGGKIGKKLRTTKMKFIFQRESIYNNCLFLYNQ